NLAGMQPDVERLERRGVQRLARGFDDSKPQIEFHGAPLRRRLIFFKAVHTAFGSNARRSESPSRFSESTRKKSAPVAAVRFHQTTGSRLNSMRAESIMI